MVISENHHFKPSKSTKSMKNLIRKSASLLSKIVFNISAAICPPAVALTLIVIMILRRRRDVGFA